MALTIVITMAGLSERFRAVGNDVPKYWIVAKGKSLLEWSLESLAPFRQMNPEIASSHGVRTRRELLCGTHAEDSVSGALG